jgi:hypothetical protein
MRSCPDGHEERDKFMKSSHVCEDSSILFGGLALLCNKSKKTEASWTLKRNRSEPKFATSGRVEESIIREEDVMT